MDQKPAIRVFSQTTVLLALAGSWLFYVGWTYLYTYLILFHIGVAQAVVPNNYLFEYGGFVVYYFGVALLILLIAFTVQVYFLWRLNLSEYRSLALILLFLISLFVSGDVLATEAARYLYREIMYDTHLIARPYRPAQGWGRPHYVEVNVDWGVANDATANMQTKTSAALAEDLAGGCYVSVWSDSSSIALIKVSPVLGPDKTKDDIWDLPYSTIRIPLNKIRSMSISDIPRAACTSAD